MNTTGTPPTRTDAGTFPGGQCAAGNFSTTHGKGEGGLTAARAVLAQVSDCDDRQIARACQVVLQSDFAESQERIDAQALLSRLAPLARASVSPEAGRACHA
jgi:hypothetical protein